MYTQLSPTLPSPVPPDQRMARRVAAAPWDFPTPTFKPGSRGYLFRSSLRAPEPQRAARGGVARGQ